MRRFNFSIEDKKKIDAQTILKSICRENTNKLVFTNININSIRSKSELHVDQVDRKSSSCTK